MSALQPLAMPLTLTLPPQAGRGDDRAFGGYPLKPLIAGEDLRGHLLPARGEKVPDRADEGPLPAANEPQRGACGEHP
jgi:hypothetical protein